MPTWFCNLYPVGSSCPYVHLQAHSALSYLQQTSLMYWFWSMVSLFYLVPSDLNIYIYMHILLFCGIWREWKLPKWSPLVFLDYDISRFREKKASWRSDKGKKKKLYSTYLKKSFRKHRNAKWLTILNCFSILCTNELLFSFLGLEYNHGQTLWI